MKNLITKEEVVEIVKANGLNEEEAEMFLAILAKKSGKSLLGVLKLIVSKTENKFDDMIVAAGENTLIDLIDDIEVNL